MGANFLNACTNKPTDFCHWGRWPHCPTWSRHHILQETMTPPTFDWHHFSWTYLLLFSVSLITFQFFAVCFRSGFQSAFKYTTSYCTVSPFLGIKNVSIACLPCQVRFCKLRRFHNITQNEPAFMMLYYNFKDFKHINRVLTRLGLNYNEQ